MKFLKGCNEQCANTATNSFVSAIAALLICLENIKSNSVANVL